MVQLVVCIFILVFAFGHAKLGYEKIYALAPVEQRSGSVPTNLKINVQLMVIHE